MKAWKAELFLVLITVIWGGTFLFTKIGIQDCPPSLYLIFRFSIALLITLIFFGKHLFKAEKKTIIHGLILGFFFGGGFVLQTYGLKYTSVPKSAFITGLAVVLVPFVFKIVERRNIKFWPKIGVIIAALGLYLFTNPRIDGVNSGDIMTIFSTVFWALYITYMDVFTRGTDSFSLTVQLVALQFVAAAPVSILTFFIFDMGNFHFNLTDDLLISIAYNAIMASFLVTFIHTSIQKYTTPVKAALIFALEPILASFFAVLFIGAVLSFKESVGAAVLMSGVLVSELGEYIFGNGIQKKY